MASAIEVTPDRPVLVDRFFRRRDRSGCRLHCRRRDQRDRRDHGTHRERPAFTAATAPASFRRFSLSKKVLDEISSATKAMARELKVRGLMNVQFAVKGEDVYVLEVNPRLAHRAVCEQGDRRAAGQTGRQSDGGKNFARTRIHEGDRAKTFFGERKRSFRSCAIKGSDISLGPEMKSTGEVMGIDVDLGLAYAKSQMAAPPRSRRGNGLCQRERHVTKRRSFRSCGNSWNSASGSSTSGRRAPSRRVEITVTKVFKIREGRPNVLDRIQNGDISFIINTPSGKIPREDEVRIHDAPCAKKFRS